METKLIISDEPVDLNINTVVAITKQAAKLGDVSSVMADGTNEFSLPLTPKNKTIFENSDILQADTNVPYQRLLATLIQQGQEIIQNGFAVLNKISNSFQIQIIGGNASFFNLIKELSLKDLDLSDYDHFWTNQSVFDNRNNTTGMIYSLFEQSNTEQETPLPTLDTYGANLYAVRTDLLLPSMFIDTLIEKIFAEQNFTFDCDVTGLDIWLKQILFNAEGWNRGTDSSYLNLSTAGTVDQDLEEFTPGVPVTYSLLYEAAITSQNSNYWDETTLNDLLINGRDSHSGALIEVHGSVLLFPDATHCVLTYNIIIDNPNTSGTQTVEIGVGYTSDNGDVFINEVHVLDYGLNNIPITFEFDAIKSPSETDYFYANETGAFLSIFCNYSVGSSYVTLKAESTASYDFTFISSYDVSPDLPYNYLRGISIVPDILQTELLKEMAKEFDLIFDTDNVTNVVSAIRLDEVRENIPEAIDMSSKLHYPVPDGPGFPQISFNLGEYGQNNILKWQGDDVTDYDGKGSIVIADETLDGEKVIVEMKFAASSTVLRFDTISAPYVAIFSDGLPNNSLKNRLLMVKQVSFPYNINFNRDGGDLPTTDVSFAYFSEPGNEDSLDFPNLIDRFFNTLSAMLNSTKVIDCNMNLNITDVINYSPFIPIYLSVFNSYFYLQKIDNFVPGKLTKCKLIKI